MDSSDYWSEVPRGCSRASEFHGLPIGAKGQTSLIKLLCGDLGVIVSMGEYEESLLAICNAEPTECAEITGG